MIRALAVATVLSLSTVTLAARADVPSAPAPEKHGSVEQEPGYYPVADPESASVRIGLRVNAPLVHKRFLGGARSLDELGRRICKGLADDKLDSLLVLCLRKDEFADILWPEFPQSRPATGITSGDGWMFLEARFHGGAVNALQEYGGKRWQFVRFERYDTTQVFKNFKLHKGLVLWAKSDDGQLERMTWMRSAVERKGRFKICSMKD